MTDSGGTTPAPIVGDHRHGYQRGTYADETSASFTVPYSGDAMVIATQISLSAAFAREISGFIAGRPDRHLSERQRPSDAARAAAGHTRSEEHTSELQSLMRISYAVFCLKTKKQNS